MTDLAYNAYLYFLKDAVTENMNLSRCCYLLLVFAAVGYIFTAYPLVIWFLLADILTLLLYDVDKMATRKDWRRVPESALLVFDVVGGWGGVIAGQQIFRHKTQKQPFRTYFIISVIVSISVMGVIYKLYPFLLSWAWLANKLSVYLRQEIYFSPEQRTTSSAFYIMSLPSNAP